MVLGEAPGDIAQAGNHEVSHHREKRDEEVSSYPMAAINRVMAFGFLTWADACGMSHTLIAPIRTNVMPSQRLAELLSMV